MATRNDIRLVMGYARSQAATTGYAAMALLADQAINEQEQLWAAVDQAQAKRQQAQAEAAKADPSAVETHGVESPQAEAKRQARREKRLRDKEAKAAVVAGDGVEAGKGEE